ncbi:uncharacterized protein LOC116167172 isoform X3 [Photinus pyralis]|uniref:uncharacterized protein LOC116167172 isoform X3 n=1 Tax=Photinus pyralis TaxID=7054 RepID=UPI0012673B7E|nr:uncharacterized protein LOC116167172 isoform X3 [Photinus pyralis]
MFTDLVKQIASILSVLRTKYSGKTVRQGIIKCDKARRRIQDSMRRSLSIGERQHLEACLRNIKSMRKHFKLEQRRGLGISLNKGTSTSAFSNRKETAKDRVHWDDSISAFSNRIRTGVITNLKHKDPGNFLMDCKTIFKSRIHNALKQDEAVKVNAIFCGEFAITQGEKMLNEYKYFTTSNLMYVIFQLKVRPSSLAHCRRPMVNTPHIYHTFNHIFVERELRTYLKQKYGSENVAILRGRGVIPDSVKIEEGSFLGRRFQVFKDLELQNTYWVFYN